MHQASEVLLAHNVEYCMRFVAGNTYRSRPRIHLELGILIT